MPDRNRPYGFAEDPAAFRSREAADPARVREVPASAAKTHLAQLLDEVERGATIVITRHGRAIARLVPEAERRWEDVNRAVDELREFGKRGGTITVEEILSLIHEGRKY